MKYCGNNEEKWGKSVCTNMESPLEHIICRKIKIHELWAKSWFLHIDKIDNSQLTDPEKKKKKGKKNTDEQYQVWKRRYHYRSYPH